MDSGSNNNTIYGISKENYDHIQNCYYCLNACELGDPELLIKEEASSIENTYDVYIERICPKLNNRIIKNESKKNIRITK